MTDLLPNKKSYSQIERSPLHNFSSTCSSTHNSRAGSLDKTSSQASNQSPCKDDSLVSDIKSSESLSCCASCERPTVPNKANNLTLFQLFNSKVLLTDQMCENGSLCDESSLSPAEEPFNLSEAEVRAILGKDLADSILVKQSTSNSVS